MNATDTPEVSAILEMILDFDGELNNRNTPAKLVQLAKEGERSRVAIAELNQRLIDRQESFQAQLIRIEDTWREKLRESQAQVVALREGLARCRADRGERDKVFIHTTHALSLPPPPCVPLADVMPLVEAMDKIHHWHDSCYNPETQKDEGMVVSAEAVRELWEASADWHRKHDPAFLAKHTTP